LLMSGFTEEQRPGGTICRTCSLAPGHLARA
jgi:hypothetical protein